MVTVYSKNNCVQCKMTKRFLDSNGTLTVVK
ncbi:nrdH-redoxin [Streptococcus pneumoniae]|nr:nrdH-redoxin [Streptococcus pneumoniae]VKL81812.1 nrdH-redoxin [Streptococcus pneumoniae]